VMYGFLVSDVEPILAARKANHVRTIEISCQAIGYGLPDAAAGSYN